MVINKTIANNNDCVTDFRASGVDRVWFEYAEGCVFVNVGPERFKFFADINGGVLVKDGQ